MTLTVCYYQDYHSISESEYYALVKQYCIKHGKLSYNAQIHSVGKTVQSMLIFSEECTMGNEFRFGEWTLIV
jgi:hypothetical protein